MAAVVNSVKQSLTSKTGPTPCLQAWFWIPGGEFSMVE
jgi:hypothetical protein